MRYSFQVDIKRGLLSVRFALAILLCTAIYWLGSIPETGATDLLYILDASISFSAFYHLLPIVAVLPFATSFLEDCKTGYATLILQRVTIRQYLTVRFFAAALIGALATLLGMFLFLILLPITHPYACLPNPSEATAIYAYMDEIVRSGNWFFYFGFYAVLQGLSALMWSSIALMLSTFAGSMQILYLSVVLLMEVLSRVLFSFNLEHVISYATGSINRNSPFHVIAEASCVMLGITLLCGLAYYALGKRRLLRA
ncbi:MAG: hypothetical protein RR142_06120 [Clostridia bacterium]